MVSYITGDIFQVTKGIIAHGVNCRGAFSSGVAGQIRGKYPWAYKDYMNKFYKYGWKLGDIQLSVENDDECSKRGDCLIIANCATQDNYGTYKVQVDYDAIAKVFNFLVKYAEEHAFPLAMPRIGAGLAGGDWNKINKILQEVVQERKVDITVYSYEPKKS